MIFLLSFLDNQNKMSEMKEYGCENLGCKNVFNWPMHFARHAKKFLKPPPVNLKK